MLTLAVCSKGVCSTVICQRLNSRTPMKRVLTCLIAAINSRLSPEVKNRRKAVCCEKGRRVKSSERINIDHVWDSQLLVERINQHLLSRTTPPPSSCGLKTETLSGNGNMNIYIYIKDERARSGWQPLMLLELLGHGDILHRWQRCLPAREIQKKIRAGWGSEITPTVCCHCVLISRLWEKVLSLFIIIIIIIIKPVHNSRDSVVHSWRKKILLIFLRHDRLFKACLITFLKWDTCRCPNLMQTWC